MKKALLYIFLSIVAISSSYAQGFGLKELLSYKVHSIESFHKSMKEKGYTYEKNKQDERDGLYAYVFMSDIHNNLHEITYDETRKNVRITFGTTEVAEYERIKGDLELLEFKFVKYVPKHENGRETLMLVFSDGHTEAHLYNSYIECPDKELVRYYRVKVL